MAIQNPKQHVAALNALAEHLRQGKPLEPYRIDHYIQAVEQAVQFIQLCQQHGIPLAIVSTVVKPEK